MTLEGLICKRIELAVAGLVAVYTEAPAVFWQYSPHDKDKGWGDAVQYPRVDYMLDLQASTSRQTSGVLSINIWCLKDGTQPEILERLIRRYLSGVFFCPDDSIPYALGWSKSDVFERREQLQKESRVIGMSMSFDLFAFPYRETTDPDPVAAMYAHIKQRWPDVKLIGFDDFKDYYTPSAQNPALYFNAAQIKRQRETNTVVWMDGVLSGHVFAPDTDSGEVWSKHILDGLALDGEAIMLDQSPMIFTSLAADNTADPLRTGQLGIGIRFGVLRDFYAGIPILNPIVQYNGG